jgi:hypothetical protein
MRDGVMMKVVTVPASEWKPPAAIGSRHFSTRP